MSGVRVDQVTIVAIAVDEAGVDPATVRKWIQRGHLTRHRDGFDPDELFHWIAARNPDALATRHGIRGGHATRLRRGA